jgi:predicted nucleic acid-binding protein
VKVLLDLNVLLDVIQEREPHYAASAELLSRIAWGELEGAVPGHALTTIHYVVSKLGGQEAGNRAVEWMLREVEIVGEDRDLFRRARSLGMKDFEDAVVAAAAEHARCDYVVTRNVEDFGGSPIPAITPRELDAGGSGAATSPPDTPGG